jgi:hypothetical protein
MIRRFSLLQTFVAMASAGKTKRAANELALTPSVRQDAHDFSLNLFTHVYPIVTNGRFEAASESKVKNANQIIRYVLGFLRFSQKISGKIFDLLCFCVFPCFLNVGIIKSMSDCYFHLLPSFLLRAG